MFCFQSSTPGARCCLAALCSVLALSVSPPPAAADAPAQTLHIVGGLAGVTQYVRFEEPFWTRNLTQLSAGKYHATIVSFDRAGVPGGDMLRLIQLGVIPFGTILMSSLSAQNPSYTAPDLAGLNPDMQSLKKNVAAFRPYLEKTLRERHGVQALALYVYPAQVIFCKKPFSGLADLKGRRIRVSGSSQADFVAALEAQPVLTAYGQIMTSMDSNSTECAITGSMAGNTLGLHEISSHIHALPVTWGLAIFAANRRAWDALPPDLRALLSHELPKLEAAIWQESEHETALGMACNKGESNCTSGAKGRMHEVPVSAQDERLRQHVFASNVLPLWLKRCKGPCAAIWNQTIGPVRGILAPLEP
jgi:TRAP-type C4-dicarboxylate transport system substrate-binding protein